VQQAQVRQAQQQVLPVPWQPVHRLQQVRLQAL
jgi:hypothetical protein